MSQILGKNSKKIGDYLATSRPTAVSLFWALDRMTDSFTKEGNKTIDEIKKALLDESDKILVEDQAMCKAIGEHSSSLPKT